MQIIGDLLDIDPDMDRILKTAIGCLCTPDEVREFYDEYVEVVDAVNREALERWEVQATSIQNILRVPELMDPQAEVCVALRFEDQDTTVLWFDSLGWDPQTVARVEFKTSPEIFGGRDPDEFSSPPGQDVVKKYPRFFGGDLNVSGSPRLRDPTPSEVVETAERKRDSSIEGSRPRRKLEF